MRPFLWDFMPWEILHISSNVSKTANERRYMAADAAISLFKYPRFSCAAAAATATSLPRGRFRLGLQLAIRRARGYTAGRGAGEATTA